MIKSCKVRKVTKVSRVVINTTTLRCLLTFYDFYGSTRISVGKSRIRPSVIH